MLLELLEEGVDLKLLPPLTNSSYTLQGWPSSAPPIRRMGTLQVAFEHIYRGEFESVLRFQRDMRLDYTHLHHQVHKVEERSLLVHDLLIGDYSYSTNSAYTKHRFTRVFAHQGALLIISVVVASVAHDQQTDHCFLLL